jgi:hypothetical protein
MKQTILIVCVVVGLGSAAMAIAPKYTVTTGIPVSHVSQVTGFNDLGHASYWINSRAYIWNGDVSIQLPHRSPYGAAPYGINNNDEVCGSERLRGAFWDNQQQLTRIDRLVDQGDSTAGAIIDSGLVAGTSNGPDGMHLFFWDGELRDGGVLPDYNWRVRDMNNNEQVIGYEIGPVRTGYLWDDGTWTALLDLQGGRYGSPKGINDKGIAVGLSYPNQQNPRPVYWQDGLPYEFPRPAEDTHGYAYDINNFDQTVGTSYTPDGWRAYFWEGGQYYDITERIDPDAEWILEDARFINDAGQIYGWGRGSTGGHASIILTPVPEPATLGMLTLGGLAILKRRRNCKQP